MHGVTKTNKKNSLLGIISKSVSTSTEIKKMVEPIRSLGMGSNFKKSL